MIAASALASATMLGGAGIAGAQSSGSLSGSLGSGSGSADVGDERVSLDFTGLDQGTASGTATTTGAASDCTVYLAETPNDAGTFSLIANGHEDTDVLTGPTTEVNEDGTWSVEDDRIDPEVSFMGLIECDIDGDTAVAIDAHGPDFGQIVGSLGS